MRYLFMTIAFFVTATSAFSATWYVPDNFPAGIQAAINSSQVKDGDTIIVRSGTYNENLNFRGKAITLTSESGPNQTVIDGNQTGSVVVFNNSEGSGSVLEGFTLQNGSGTLNPFGNYVGGGIYCWDSSPTITSCIISDNACAFGGGLYCHNHLKGPFPVLTANTFSGNSAGNGGGIYCNETSPEIRDNTFTGNSSDYGAGIMCWESSPEITGNSISGNSGVQGGGGGIICSTNSDPTITENTISQNSNFWGGGVYCYQSSPEIRENTITQNTADKGAGIACQESSPEIKNNTVSLNNATTEGAGIFCSTDCSPVVDSNVIRENSAGLYGGGLEFWNNCGPTITNNFILDNHAVNDAGGGVLISYYCTGTIANNVIALNTSFGTAYGGGGISMDRYTELEIMNNMIYWNTSNNGGGIDVNKDSTATIQNNTLFGNSAGNGGGISCRSSSNAVVVNSILWDNNATQGPEIFIASNAFPSTVDISYSDVEGGLASVEVKTGCTLIWDALSIINANPQFVDAANGDCHVYCTSPCCGTGDNSAPNLPSEDFEGDPRIASGTVDMGADEFHTHLYYTGDATPGGTVQLNFVGPPGETQVALIVGFSVFDPPLPGAYGDWHIAPPMILITGLGSIPTNGVYVLSGILPPSIPGPYTVYLQAMIGYQLTNLCVMKVE